MIKKQLVCLALAFALLGFAGAQESTKKVSFDVNMGYAPLALFAGDTIGTTFSPAGARVSFAVFFLEEPFGNLGAELTANWLMTTTEPNDNILTANIIPIHTNFVYQYVFNKSLALDSHVGLGLNMYVLQLEPANEKPPLLEFAFSVDLGTALQIAITQGFYTEVGVDYIVSFPQSLVIHHLVPALTFGYKF